MSDNSNHRPKRLDSMSTGKSGPRGEAREEEMVRQLFQRTTPPPAPVDTEALFRQFHLRSHARERWSRRKLLGAAALALFSALVAGWWAGERGAAWRIEELESRLERNLVRRETQILTEVTGTIASAQRQLQEAEQEALKQVAVLLRDDYQARLARLNVRLDDLAMSLSGGEVIALRRMEQED